MRIKLLEWLACPDCLSSFKIESIAEKKNEDILSGKILCLGCNLSYPIKNGIPRILPDYQEDKGRKMSDMYKKQRLTQASFGYEWLNVEVTDFEEDIITFFRKTGIDPMIYSHLGYPSAERYYPTLRDVKYYPDGSFLNDKVILDVGCGMGRYLNVVKDYRCEAIGLDLSLSVERGRKLLEGYPNIHFVQGDIMHPPFRKETFDFMYSIGVLHHTPNTRRAFDSIVPLCRIGGTIAIYVYPVEYWQDPIRGTMTKMLRKLTVRLSHATLMNLCKTVGSPLGNFQTRLAKKKWLKIVSAPFFIITIPRHSKNGVMIGDTFDLYSPQFIWTHDSKEVEDWFREGGFKDLKVLNMPTSVKGVKNKTK